MRNFEAKSERKVGQFFEKQGVRVDYQYKCGPYFLDLYLPDHYISVEVYGPHHIIHERIKKDTKRSEFIRSEGINEFIITAQEVYDQKRLKQFVKEVLNTKPKRNFQKAYNNKPLNNQLAIQIREKITL